MSEAKHTISVFFHNYYGNDANWKNFLTSRLTVPFHLFYNCVRGSYPRLLQEEDPVSIFRQQVPEHLLSAVITQTPNKGKDIGGKLVLMDAYLRMGIRTEFILLLHDKHSPYHANNLNWKNDLFRIAEPQYRADILSCFEQDPTVGIVASGNAIRNESDNEEARNAYINGELITSLRRTYNIHPKGLRYVAGTMFWVRASLFEEFFCNYAPLMIREHLEPGNVSDDSPTQTHAWERLLCWLVLSKGYQIKGI